jgi:hypothetical protein
MSTSATTSKSGYGSDILVKTQVQKGWEPRGCYLTHRDILPPPQIAHSYFVPKATVEFLMRCKKDSAIAVKFFSRNHPPDRITDLEGALHTFVTPVVLATMHGDYQYKYGHGVEEFGLQDGYQLGRKVLVSALVQQDFELDRVMMRVAGLGSTERVGETSLPTPITTPEKQDSEMRGHYDNCIRNYLVYHLTHDHRLPAISESIKETAMSIRTTLDFLAKAIESTDAGDLPKQVRNVFFHHKKYYVSLEIMFFTAVHQIRNEMVLLERFNKERGYVYTFNPPAIFVHLFNEYGTELLARIHVAALKYVAGALMPFRHCKVFAWANFNSPLILGLIRHALHSQPHIRVMSNDELFSGRPEGGLYNPPKEAKGAMLVIHNNSDAFGQNIETEPSGGSLDGVVGEYSSAAGSLARDREDLSQHLLEIRPI